MADWAERDARRFAGRRADEPRGAAPQAEGAAEPTADEMRTAHRTLLLTRRLDEKMMILLKQGKSFFHIGASGHEAVQVGGRLRAAARARTGRIRTIATSPSCCSWG